MQKEIIELVKKCEINQVKYGCSLIFDNKGNVIGRVKNIEKGGVNNEINWCR